MMGLQSNGANNEKEIVAIRNKFLRIDSNHLGMNNSLEHKELMTKNKVDFIDIKKMLSLEILSGHQFKIILEGGLLLCQLREIHKDRDCLIKNMKQFIKNIAKSKIENIEELEKVIQGVVPVFSIDSNEEVDNLPNPILRLLVESLYSSVKKVKAAYEEAKERQTSEGEEIQNLIKDLAIKLKKVEKSEKYYKKELNKIIEINNQADKRIYAIEQSKQEIIKMRDSDYDIMVNKNAQLVNELKTLQKYFDAKVEECEALELSKQDWIQKHNEFYDIIKAKDQEIERLKEENFEINRKYNILERDFKDLKVRKIETVHTHKISQLIDDSHLNLFDNNESLFPLFRNINSVIKPNKNTISKSVVNSIGIKISSFLEIKDFNKLVKVNKEFREFFTSTSDVLKIISFNQSVINEKSKETIESLKYQIAKLEAEVSQHQKDLFLRYDKSKDEIRDFLIEFMRDEYEPGKKIKDSLDRSCNMIINYTRITQIEDPIEKIYRETGITSTQSKNVAKEVPKLKEESNGAVSASTGAFDIIRQSIFSIGSTFSSDSNQSKKTDTSDSSAQKKKQEEEKKQKSNGFFDTFFRPIEINKDELKSKAREEASKAKELTTKSKEAEVESEEDFFSKNLGDIDRSGGRSTMAIPTPHSIVIPNISSLDVFNYYKEKPKELTKLFHQIGKQIMSSKDGKSGKWIQDIIKEYVSLLLYSAYTYDEVQKLDKIKHYFALKIEKVIEEKKDCLRNLDAMQGELRSERKLKDEAREEERVAKVKLMEKSTEFTVRINELLKISDERDHAIRLAEFADK